MDKNTYLTMINKHTSGPNIMADTEDEAQKIADEFGYIVIGILVEEIYEIYMN